MITYIKINYNFKISSIFHIYVLNLTIHDFHLKSYVRYEVTNLHNPCHGTPFFLGFGIKRVGECALFDFFLSSFNFSAKKSLFIFEFLLSVVNLSIRSSRQTTISLFISTNSLRISPRCTTGPVTQSLSSCSRIGVESYTLIEVGAFTCRSCSSSMSSSSGSSLSNISSSKC